MKLSEIYITRLKKLANISESKKEKNSDEIHLPELTMNKKDLIKYLEKMYDIKIKD